MQHMSSRGEDLRRRALHKQSMSRLIAASPDERLCLAGELARPLAKTDIFLANTQVPVAPPCPAAIVLPATPPATPMCSKSLLSGSTRQCSQQMESLLVVPGELNFRQLRGASTSGIVREGLGEMLGTSMLRSLTFIVICFAGVLAMLGFFIPVVYLPTLIEYSLDLEREKAYWLISILGICNTLGRIFTGLLADRAWANPLLINNIALILAGGLTIIMPFSRSFIELGVLSCFFGLSMAAFISLRSIIIVQLFGVERLTNGFGLLLMFQGVATLIGTPTAGLVLDLTKDPSTTFYIAGGVILLSGLMCFPVERLRLWELRHRPGLVSQPPRALQKQRLVA